MNESKRDNNNLQKSTIKIWIYIMNMHLLISWKTEGGLTKFNAGRQRWPPDGIICVYSDEI